MMTLLTALMLASPPTSDFRQGEKVVVTAGPYKGCHAMIDEAFRYYFERRAEYFGLEMVQCENGPDYIDYFVHESDLKKVGEGEQ